MTSHPGRLGHTWEHWHWDAEAKSTAVQLSACQQAVYFHTNMLLESEGSAGVRGTKGFCSGEHYWEIEFLEPPYGSSVMVGLGTKEALLHTGNTPSLNLLGMDGESWGLSYKGSVWHNGVSRKYTEAFYDKSTVIGVLLNLDSGALRFYRSGISLGVAFTGLDKVTRPLYPLVSSTAPETELLLGLRTHRLTSLQDSCLHVISKALRSQAHLESLPLPLSMCEQLHISPNTGHQELFGQA
ncbi:SPRY domain-containing SOCS box protein 3 [Sardina pilchardus]|uniref:SPRY domain-containing SOCS box protein 3 n=1 Tax=Sardina pilchardus TaxID=27697 RepID=UPI002E0DECB1